MAILAEGPMLPSDSAAAANTVVLVRKRFDEDWDNGVGLNADLSQGSDSRSPHVFVSIG